MNPIALSYIIIKFPEAKDKKKKTESSQRREKKHHTWGTNIRFFTDVSLEIMEVSWQWNDIAQVLKKNAVNIEFYIQWKYPPKWDEIKRFSDKWKLKVLVIRLVTQGMLKGVLWAEEKWYQMETRISVRHTEH